MLVGSATTIVVVTLLAIYALDNPYRQGLGSIRPVAMETRSSSSTRRGRRWTTVEPRCDERNAAVSDPRR